MCQKSSWNSRSRRWSRKCHRLCKRYNRRMHSRKPRCRHCSRSCRLYGRKHSRDRRHSFGRNHRQMASRNRRSHNRDRKHSYLVNRCSNRRCNTRPCRSLASCSMIRCGQEGSVKVTQGREARAGRVDTPAAIAVRSQPPPIACAVDSTRDRDRRVARLARDRYLGLRALF